jgi:phage tail-like protein
VPLVGLLPAMLQADPFARQLCASADEVLAPIILSLDCFPAYLDVATTPDDMLAWLSHWVGVDLNPQWDPARQRALVAAAPNLHRRRGTLGGVKAMIEVVFGIDVEVIDSGASGWSARPDTELPGQPGSTFTVRLHLSPGQQFEADNVGELVRSVIPAHVSCDVEVLTVNAAEERSAEHGA